MRVNVYVNVNKQINKYKFRLYIYIMKIMYMSAGNFRFNFCLHLCKQCANSIFPKAHKTCNVRPLSHLLPRKALMEQTKRSEINQKKRFLSIFGLTIFLVTKRKN